MNIRRHLYLIPLLLVSLLFSSATAKKMVGDESIFVVDTTQIKTKAQKLSKDIDDAIITGYIGRARDNLEIFANFLKIHKKVFTKNERKTLNLKLKNYEDDILKAEDALIAIADSLIQQFRIKEAKNFLQKKLNHSGIEVEKFQKLEKRLLLAESGY